MKNNRTGFQSTLSCDLSSAKWPEGVRWQFNFSRTDVHSTKPLPKLTAARFIWKEWRTKWIWNLYYLWVRPKVPWGEAWAVVGNRRLWSPGLYQSSISTELTRTIQKQRESFWALITASPLWPSQTNLGWKNNCVTKAAQGKVMQ